MGAPLTHGLIALAASVVFTTSLALAAGAPAAESPPPRAATGLICNTEAQVEQFIEFTKTEGDMSAAIEAVNAAVGDPQACGLAKIRFVAGEDVRQTGTFKIARVLVVGFNDGETWRAIQPPYFQFTIFDPGGQDV
jgi:hypothetical protein